jgi:hypothetical protein
VRTRAVRLVGNSEQNSKARQDAITSLNLKLNDECLGDGLAHGVGCGVEYLAQFAVQRPQVLG